MCHDAIVHVWGVRVLVQQVLVAMTNPIIGRRTVHQSLKSVRVVALCVLQRIA